ncbi:MAG: S8 family peptidase [Acidobacteriia bacterium]|nr:S8 family peptidase [Terriglobia bacterium]
MSAAFGQAQPRSFREDDVSTPRRSHRLSPELSAVVAQASDDRQGLQVIVQFRKSPSTGQLQHLASLGGVHQQRLNAVRGGVFTLPVAALRALANDPDVAYISPNRSLSGAADYAEATVGADVAQRTGLDGSGITVAVIDSGITDSPDLRDLSTGQSRILYSESFVPGTDTADHYGHGTHVAGIIAGNGQQSGGRNNPSAIYGVAPRARLVNLKVLDSNGSGQDSYVIAALQRAIALKNTYNIRVVNLSLGRPVFESYTLDPLCQAVESAWKAGLVVVVAAGNQGRNNKYHTHGYGMISAPGNDPDVITVGAMNTMGTPTKGDDLIASYSSRGPTVLDHVVKPDLVAPGNRIASLLVPGSTLDVKFKTDEVSPTTYGAASTAARAYFKLSGTSMATPVVSGAAALLLHQDSTLTPDVVKARLMKTADKVFPQHSQILVDGVLTDYQYDLFTVGAGYLDIPNALANDDTVQGTALSPVAVLDSDGNVFIMADPSAIWDTSVIWGNSLIWGNTLLTGTSVIWGNSVVWGNDTLAGYSVIWGNSVIWGSSIAAANEAENIDGSGDDDGE